MRESIYLVDEDPDKTNTDEIIRYDFQPKPIRFFGTADPTMKADPRLARTRPNYSRGKKDDPSYQ
jgi:hypothetical protein